MDNLLTYNLRRYLVSYLLPLVLILFSTNVNASELIKRFEGLRLEAYLCQAGVWTIGYGHTGDVKKGDKITLETAEKLLRADLRRFEAAVDSLVAVKLSEGQREALISFTYNVGIGAFKRSTLLRLLNSGDYKGASKQFMRWIKAGGKVSKGLIKRRAAEQRLFSTGKW